MQQYGDSYQSNSHDLLKIKRKMSYSKHEMISIDWTARNAHLLFMFKQSYESIYSP